MSELHPQIILEKTPITEGVRCYEPNATVGRSPCTYFNAKDQTVLTIIGQPGHCSHSEVDKDVSVEAIQRMSFCPFYAPAR